MFWALTNCDLMLMNRVPMLMNCVWDVRKVARVSSGIQKREKTAKRRTQRFACFSEGRDSIIDCFPNVPLPFSSI